MTSRVTPRSPDHHDLSRRRFLAGTALHGLGTAIALPAFASLRTARAAT